MKQLTLILGLLLAIIPAHRQGTNVAGATGTSTSGVGGSGLAANSPGIPSYNGQTVFYAANYGVKADTYAVQDAVCTNGTNIITSATAHFTTRAKINVGQTMWAVPGAGQGNSVPSVPKTTVLSIDSDTQIHSTANGTAACGASQFLVWGDDDTAAFRVFEAAFYSAINCSIAHLPAGGMMVNGGIMARPEPVSCNAGQTIAAAGMVGEGITSSVFYPTPDFDPTTCTGSGKTNCFGPNNGVRHDFGIEGGGLIQTASPSTTFNILDIESPQSIYNVSCLFWAEGDTNATGMVSGLGQEFIGSNVEIAQCGALGPSINAGAQAGPVYGNYWVPVGGNITIASGTPGMDYISNWFAISAALECTTNVTGFAHVFGLYNQPGAEACVTGGTATFDGTMLSHNQSIAGRAALKLTSGAKVSAANSTFVDAGTGEFSVSVDATSKFTDACGNSYTGPINVASGGIFVVCRGAVYPASSSVLQVSGNFADSTGIGTTTFGTVSGTGYRGQVTVSYAGTLATPATFTMTFPTTWAAAPSCSVVDVGGTNPFPTQIDTTGTATTTTLLTVKLTFAVAPVAANTDIFVWDCTP